MKKTQFKVGDKVTTKYIYTFDPIEGTIVNRETKGFNVLITKTQDESYLGSKWCYLPKQMKLIRRPEEEILAEFLANASE